MSEPRSRRGSTDPLQMSVAEKLACEWEARHDVAARGRIADAAPVQHYLTHVRCTDTRHPTTPHHHRAAAEPDVDELYVRVPLFRGWVTWERFGR
jgi:hypothetical protein